MMLINSSQYKTCVGLVKLSIFCQIIAIWEYLLNEVILSVIASDYTDLSFQILISLNIIWLPALFTTHLNDFSVHLLLS